jgi:hypothetical protein
MNAHPRSHARIACSVFDRHETIGFCEVGQPLQMKEVELVARECRGENRRKSNRMIIFDKIFSS